jgi:hypothetical protein
VAGSRPQLPLQHRGPQQIQRTPAAVAPQQGSGSASRSPNHPINSSRPPPVTALHIPSTSSPLHPSGASPGLSRAPFSTVTLPPRTGTMLRSEQRAPAPHLARARPHISAQVPTSTMPSAPGNVAVSAMEQLQSLFARSQEGAAARSQTQTQNLPESLIPFLQEDAAAPSQTQTQNLPLESRQASFGNDRSSGQVPVGDAVVCLSDDD